MKTTLTIKLDKKLRDDAKRAAHSMGVPLTTAVNAMMKQFVRDRVLVLEAECPFPSHTPNAETRRAIRELQNPKTRAKLKSYANADEMFADILGKNWRRVRA
jgi:DNA-damage-inducible protein J